MSNLSLKASINSYNLIKEGEEVETVPIRNELAQGVKYDDVHIIPSYVEFTEASEGVTYRQRITIKNIGKKSKFIRIRQPNSIAFQIRTMENAIQLSPGLSVTTYVNYTFKMPSLLRAIIPIEINGKIFDYRVICTLTTEQISIEPKLVDFDTVDIGYPSGLKIVKIRNEGGKSTRFSIDLGKNDLNIMIKPIRGIVRPRKEVKLQMELIGQNEGVFYSEFWIKSIPNIRVPVKVKIIIPRLRICHPNTAGDLTLIDFPPTVESTSKYDTFVLQNLSSRVSSYVVLAELNNEMKPIRDVDYKRHPTYSAFDIQPIEGRMDPFQSVIFNVRFSPTRKLSQWKQKYGPKQQIENSKQIRENEDFMVFIKIVRIHCTEAEDVRIAFTKNFPMEDVTSSEFQLHESTTQISLISTVSNASNKYSRFRDIKICLYGQTETAQLHFEPDILYFGDLMVDQVSQRVIHLTNSSAVASIYLKYIRNASARCYPAQLQLKPKATIDVLVKIRGKDNIESSFKLFFDATVDTYILSASKRCIKKVKIGRYSVDCMVNILLKSKQGFLSEKSLTTTKATNVDNEIIERILQPPKWKCKDYLGIIKARMRKVSPEKPICMIKTAVLIPLSPLQIYNVHVYPAFIAFGMVAPRSYNYRRLVVKNKNNIPVMVRLESLSTKCIYFPEGNLMILQPNSTMTRFIEYRAEHIGKFNGYIDYVINDNHIFELNIIAKVVRQKLYIDESEIVLGENEWLIQESYRPIASFVRITNKLDTRISFTWEIPATSGYYMEPMSGSVRGNATLHVYVYYEPDKLKRDCIQAMMKCQGVNCASLQFSIPRIVPKVEFVNDHVNLGDIPLNLPTRITAVLQNFEFNEILYEVDSDVSLIANCNVYPLRGKISPRGITILEVQLTLDVCCRFSTMIAVTIQGGLRLIFKINGNVLFPRLKILPERIVMKHISLNSFQTHKITAMNIGTTILKLRFLLKEYPEFRVSLSSNGEDSDGTENVIIDPGASQCLYLHFQPIDIATFAFYLPMMINELLGPVSMLDPTTMRPLEYLKVQQSRYANSRDFIMTPLPDKLPVISIDCTVACPIVFFSKLLFHFNVTTNELREELVIENRMTSRETLVSINIKDFNEVNCPFTIEWSAGEQVKRTSDSIECYLTSNSRVFFVLEFKPKKRGNFSIEAPIYIRGELDSNMFNKLRLDGQFPTSSIDVEPSEIYLTPVPLGVTITEEFKIQAKYFDNTTLIRTKFLTPVRCSGDYNEKLLSIDFPNDNAIPPHMYTELEAKVTFKSDRPVSFCLTIEFQDDLSLTVCLLRVYARADNNLLTTYMYPLRLSMFDDPCVALKHLKKYATNHSLVSLSEEMNENEQLPRIRELSETTLLRNTSNTSQFDDRRRTSSERIIDTKLRLTSNEKINDINDIINDKSMQSEQKMEEREKLISIRSKCEKHLCRIIRNVEEWMYSSPLRFQFYPNIPHGITASFSNLCTMKVTKAKSSKVRKNKTSIPSFMDILESLAESKFQNYFGEILKQPLPDNNIERIEYILRLYDKVLDFLASQGAHLAHVSVQFLLSYHDYITYVGVVQCKTCITSTDTNERYIKLSRELFESCSKQCWLDMILQTYKCFVLAKIHENKYQTLSSFTSRTARRSTVYRDSIALSLPRQYEIHEKAAQSIARLPKNKLTTDNRCLEERYLLAWLQYCYEQQRLQEWMTDRRVIMNPWEKRELLEHRVIQNFHNDLADCLVLIAVTAMYCPFLVDEYFNNLYICPGDNEEMMHNAICLVTAWRKIRLGFMITPMELIDPNSVQMLMLTVHLYEILPTYSPLNKIKFSCPLSQTMTKQINISNPTSNAITYVMLLVNNINCSFTILKPASVLHLNAHHSSQVHIQFYAKKIQNSRVYLLLCGRTIGPHFGRNQVFVLEGQVDSLGITNEYNICTKLYEIVDTKLKIDVPYPNAAEYDIWLTEERPNHPSTLKMTRWCELRKKKIPRRFFINQKSINVVDGTSEAYLFITIACIASKKRIFWLIFQGKVGDFIIQINSTWKVSLNDRIIVEWTAQGECICSSQQDKIKNSCPFNVNIPIPSRNTQLWKCVTEMFQKTLDSKERLFWSKYLNTHTGLRLLQYLMKDTTDSAKFVHIFDTTTTYKVAVSDKSGSIVVPEYFTVPDVKWSNEQVPMTVHILSTSQLYETTMTLTSLDHKELRMYIIDCLRL